MKTKDELNALKAELEALTAKLRELSDDELEQVTGGCAILFTSEILEASRGAGKAVLVADLPVGTNVHGD